MDMQKVLSGLSRNLFNYDYEKFIQDSLLELQQEAYLKKIESDYQNAKILLHSTLNKGQRQAFIRIEAQYDYRQSYAVKFSFYCGLYAAFEEHFRNGMTDFFTFHKLVQEGLLQFPGMSRHPDFRVSLDKSMEHAAYLDEEEPACSTYLSVVLTALEERINSAALISFYCGYQAALSLMVHIMPLNISDIVSQIQMTEYELGLTRL